MLCRKDTQREALGARHPKNPNLGLAPPRRSTRGISAAGKRGAAREAGKGEPGKAGAARLLHVRPLLGVSQGGGG